MVYDFSMESWLCEIVTCRVQGRDIADCLGQALAIFENETGLNDPASMSCHQVVEGGSDG